jgi:phosphohistidine phosphatase
MKLYFLRHGIAYEREAWQGENDELRPLTDEGVEDMKREARTLRNMGLKLDTIVTSPLVRARQTAKIVAKKLEMDVQEDVLLKPGFDVEALGALLARHSAARRLMLVGHEPDFSRTIAQLIGGGTVAMAKGGLARVDTDDDAAHNRLLRGTLIWLLTPKLLGANNGH